MRVIEIRPQVASVSSDGIAEIQTQSFIIRQEVERLYDATERLGYIEVIGEDPEWLGGD